MVNTIAFTLFAGLAAVANAYTKADTSVTPNGNNITTPATGGSVNAGQNFDITWIPTSKGTVTIYLCKGPSTNCVNQEVPLADKVANSGKFSWAVAKTLEPSTTTGQGYGIQLVDDVDTKIYQYSGQFGIVNKDYTSSSSASSSASATGSASSSASASSTANSTVTATTSASSHATITGTATGGANSTIIQPTGSLTVPSSLRTTATGSHTGSSSASTSARPTGAAGAVQVGVGAIVGGVLAALAL